jgi:hypothetical protein
MILENGKLVEACVPIRNSAGTVVDLEWRLGVLFSPATVSSWWVSFVEEDGTSKLDKFQKNMIRYPQVRLEGVA